MQERTRIHETVQELTESVGHVMYDMKNVRMMTRELWELLHTNGGGALLQRFTRMEREVRNTIALRRAQTPIATWEAIVDADDPDAPLIPTGISPAWVELTGMSSADRMLNGRWRDIVAEYDIERVAAAFKHARQENQKCIVEFDLINFVTKIVSRPRWIGTPQCDDYDNAVTGWTVEVFSLVNSQLHIHRRASDALIALEICRSTRP